jgi:hypothetical protein
MKLADFTEEELTCFAFVPGRFYVALMIVKLPLIAAPKGGNLTSLLWRPDNVSGQWVFQMRYRYYGDSNPRGNKDRKSWHAALDTKGGSDTDALHRSRGAMMEIGRLGGTAQTFDKVDLFGDNERAMAAIFAAKKEWLHIQQEISE